MGTIRRSAKPVLALNIISAGAGGAAFLLGGDFQTVYFLAMLAITGFVFVSATMEDVRMTPTGTQIRRALFKSGHPYSPERHREALENANVIVAIGGIMLAETIGISLAVAILRP
jgi:hypothetical protein